MTDFLLRLFVKDYRNTKDTKVRTCYGKLSGIVGIICNAVLFLGKLAAGSLSGSVSITADAFNNLSDASSSIISLFGFRLSERPPDKEHPYGHGRYEYISGLVVAALVMAIGVELFKSSFDKILHPSEVNFSITAMAVLAVSVLIKVWMMFFNRKLGNKINSQTLLATSADSRNDVISTCSVLIASAVSHFSGIELDGYAGLAVAIFIIINGYGLIKDTIDPILGHAPDPEYVKNIYNRIMSYPGVIGMHDLIVHDYGPGRQFASVHIEMDADKNPIESHDIIDNIEKDFWESDSLNLIIHYDPIVTTDPEANAFREWLPEHIKEIHPELSAHDIRMVKGLSHTNVIFDCVMPYDLNITEAELKKEISEMIKERFPNYWCVITIDKNYSLPK
ncbi:MAG: cation-efflux pump [Oscillospiraceae bacterium]|jgi:cation diffusion facilitator family transporter|nr:MAG: cation-efflux pump [Oscillospiraceae bacterium]